MGQRLRATTIAQPATSAAKSARLRSPGRARGSTPAREMRTTGSRFSASAAGRRAFAIVLRRCAKVPRTMRSNVSGGPISTGGGRNVRRSTVDVTSGGGRKAPGGSVKSRVACRVEVRVDAQDAVLAGSRAGQHPVGDLLLQHHGGIAHDRAAGCPAEEPEEDRRADVVGQVAHDPHRLPAGLGGGGPLAGRDQAGEIELQKVRRRMVTCGGDVAAR